MSLLSGLKNKIIGRKQEEDVDMENLRGTVLGHSYPPKPISPSEIKRQSPKAPWQKEMENQPENVQLPKPPMFEHDERVQPDFSRKALFESREPEKKEMHDKYEILDRLGIIEAQLTAIRSQTETINERLKMLDIKLGRGRRY